MGPRVSVGSTLFKEKTETKKAHELLYRKIEGLIYQPHRILSSIIVVRFVTNNYDPYTGTAELL